MKKVAGFIAFVSMFSTASHAQMTWYPPVGTWSGPAQLNGELINDSLSQVSDPKSKDDSSVNNLASSTSLTYSPNRKRTNQNLQTFADKTRAVDPAQAEQLEQLFASTDIMAQISGVMSSVGLSKNNVADAFALYWVNAWQVAHGDSSTPSAKTMKAVATQAARGLSQSPEFANANEAQKQEMAEALMIQGVMIASAFEQLAGNKTQLEAVGKAVKQGASASGLELDTMTLTEEGFREGGPRKRSDASDTAENQKALAANDTGTDGDTTNYALIAAAAGAGLGGVFLLGKVMGRRG